MDSAGQKISPASQLQILRNKRGGNSPFTGIKGQLCFSALKDFNSW